MSNLCGKCYGLTSVTRMHPFKTLGVRAVFLLIRVSTLPKAQRGFVGGVLAGIAVLMALGVLQLIGINVGLVMRVGSALGASGLAAWAAGLVGTLLGFGTLGAIVGSVYEPKWTILGRIQQVQVNLTELSFIHFARWVIIGRNSFPHLGATQPREQLSYDYFLFESNFNGDWEKYIAAFSQVVPGGMDNIWRWSVKYPKSRPITPFLQYIRNCQYDTDYYYSAYPGASTNDVLGAVRLRGELASLAKKAAEMPAVEFAAEYRRVLVRVQNCLAKTGPPPAPAIRNEKLRRPTDVAAVPRASATSGTFADLAARDAPRMSPAFGSGELLPPNPA